jgi:uncharacterized membrane protein YedE/YeeE
VQSVSVLLIGLVFGVGLTLSGMLDPERILSFLGGARQCHWLSDQAAPEGASVR